MKCRWRLLIAAGALLAAAVAVPVAAIESGCRAPIPSFDPHAPYRSLAGGRRPEARTWLTYPEWHIVYSAESLARWLSAGNPPSGYAYGQDVAGFWRGFCKINRVSRGQPGAGKAKVMIYTIGISFTAELMTKAVYENTIGRLSEAIGGWRSADDRYAAAVQARYGRFMHETPWFRFPFGRALAGEWRTSGRGAWPRHVERRFALSAEYGVKGAYAKLIGLADAASFDTDAHVMPIVVRAAPARVAAVDPRLQPIQALGGGLTVVRAPRYAQFTDLAVKLASAGVPIVEVAGNDDIFTTLLLPDGARPAGAILLDMPIERRGWRRVGTSVKVPQLDALLTWTRAAGGQVEHVYDY